MNFSALTVVACAASLTWFALLQAAIAADNPSNWSYGIELKVPPAQRKLLESNLDLYRWRDSMRMNEVQLHRLVQQAPEQIRGLLSTEGFYSPKIETRMEHNDPEWTVILDVDPGKPVHVNRFDIQVTGPLSADTPRSLDRLKMMRDQWHLVPGVVFRHDEWDAAKRNALKTLLLDG